MAALCGWTAILTLVVNGTTAAASLAVALLQGAAIVWPAGADVGRAAGGTWLILSGYALLGATLGSWSGSRPERSPPGRRRLRRCVADAVEEDDLRHAAPERAKPHNLHLVRRRLTNVPARVVPPRPPGPRPTGRRHALERALQADRRRPSPARNQPHG